MVFALQQAIQQLIGLWALRFFLQRVLYRDLKDKMDFKDIYVKDKL
jgi:hypothetical protein